MFLHHLSVDLSCSVCLSVYLSTYLSICIRESRLKWTSKMFGFLFYFFPHAKTNIPKKIMYNMLHHIQIICSGRVKKNNNQIYNPYHNNSITIYLFFANYHWNSSSNICNKSKKNPIFYIIKRFDFSLSSVVHLICMSMDVCEIICFFFVLKHWKINIS